MTASDAQILELIKMSEVTLKDVEMELEVRLVESGLPLIHARDLILLHAVLARQEDVRA